MAACDGIRLRSRWLAVLALCLGCVRLEAAEVDSAAANAFADTVQPFLVAHCLDCHGDADPEGDLRLDDISTVSSELRRWALIREQLSKGSMPPKGEERPDQKDVEAVVRWINLHIAKQPPRLPNDGNLVAHELLFGIPPAEDALAASPRVWRLSPDGYRGFVNDVSRSSNPRGVVQPFTVTSERGIQDFANLYSIDESSTEILLRNARAIVEIQTAHEFRDGKIRGKGHDTVREFIPLMDPAIDPTREQLTSAITRQFQLALGRDAEVGEVERLIGLYERSDPKEDSPAAVKIVLQAILLRADAMHRMEIGDNSHDPSGRAMLPPVELARALSLTLGHRRERGLMQAAEKGELSTKEQVAAHVRRILADDRGQSDARLLEFFHAYFEYNKAPEVFKDKPDGFMHRPEQLVADTDHLVMYVVNEDRDVFRRLLTTPRSFVNLKFDENKKTRRRDVPAQAIEVHPINNRGQQGPEYVYGVPRWSPDQPMEMPKDTRLGILMQPSWLIAWSLNFDNDPVRRGRWVRERLLGGAVPQLPIGVAAMIPDDPHRTLRDRLTLTRDARCWKCHQQMDELGLPFENFDHFGRFRRTEAVLDPEATEQNVDNKGQPLGPITREAGLITSGEIADSGDLDLDGRVKDGREMVRRIAESDRARQVFIRHAFRFFLGRNESLADAHTLQEADRAYQESGGSFKTLVVSLLTSDSFLYRAVPTVDVSFRETKFPLAEKL